MSGTSSSISSWCAATTWKTSSKAAPGDTVHVHPDWEVRDVPLQQLRVGFVAAHQELIDELVPLKLVSGLTTSELTEELALTVLLQGRHRKHVKQLQSNLADAHETVARLLEGVGMELFVKPHAGMFLWARHPLIEDSTALATKARDEKILLAPGQLFMPNAQIVPWMRFNVAHSLDERIYRLLEREIERL